MTITSIHHNLAAPVSKSIIKAMIGSINATVIAYTRGHLKFGHKPKDDAVRTIDDHNDEIAAVADALQRERFAVDAGLETQMPTGELIERLMSIRAFFSHRLENMAASKNDTPLTIAETVQFQLSRTPDNSDAHIGAIVLALGDDFDITPEMLKMAKLKMDTDDASELRAYAGRIVDYLGQYSEVDFEFEDEVVDDNFDTLPAHVRYKLISAAIRAHDKASQKALITLLRKGTLDAAGDIKMIKANKTLLLNWLIKFSQDNRHTLDAYLERGGQLMEIDDRVPVTSNESKMQRAPAPVK